MLSVEQRLARLESSVRRWRVVSVALVGLVGFMAADFPTGRLTGFGYFDTVYCKQLVVKNGKGEDVASLVTTSDTGSCLFTLQNGKARTMMLPGLPIVAGDDENGKPWKIVR